MHIIKGMNPMSFEYKLCIFILSAAFLATTAMTAEGMGGYAVNLTTNATLGTYLVNQTGFTLYYFMNDAPGNGTSQCYGGCAKIWMPFYAKNITVLPELNAKDFTAMNRTDSMMQVAYKGWPLYLYPKDTKPGMALGQGFKGIWFVVNPMKFPPMKA